MCVCVRLCVCVCVCGCACVFVGVSGWVCFKRSNPYFKQRTFVCSYETPPSGEPTVASAHRCSVKRKKTTPADNVQRGAARSHQVSKDVRFTSVLSRRWLSADGERQERPGCLNGSGGR